MHYNNWALVPLVHLHHTVDLPHEPEARKESNGAGEQEEQEHHDECVAKVEERGGGVLDWQFGHEVVAAVDEQIHCSESWSEERSPPPLIVLGAQMEIAKQDRGF